MCPVANYGIKEGSAIVSNDKSIYKSFKEMTGRKCPAVNENGFCLTSLQGKLLFKAQHRQIVLRSEAQEVFTNCNCNRITGAGMKIIKISKNIGNTCDLIGNQTEIA